MKIKYLPVLLALSCFFCSCFNNKLNGPAADIYTDTLTYQYLEVKSRADDCGSKPDSGCTVAHFRYPKFDNQPLLNDTLVTGVAMLIDPAKGAAGLQRLSWYFLADYDNFKQSHPDWKGKFELDTKASIIRQDSSLIAVEFNGYEFAGGAHGTSAIRYLNWNTQSRKKIQLKDILKPGYETQLTTTAEKIFRKQENLSATASLSRDYFFKDGKFSLNNNFLITPVGLKFLYNQGEIKPNAAGQTTVEIPYDQIKSIIQPETVLARYTN
ncbi:DUF3298 and DUF4163 domain-containing protein [Mucilaginibacter lacusdianchii]|uniref:DUF3298 and DUF4163 domain-containing protein n=1 Tax=Mucilaginibacter lacusdianchii TaxID=2684211 RepID=UPI00131B91EF|nr:DUF3298 and DUF4163 domain-containing protein [Mucilaginibacter sp. JXJ CY 39]